jgi:hypothetical protein
MVAIGMGLTLGGYALFMVGFCWVRGYDVGFLDVWKTRWPGVTVTQTPGHKLGTITGPPVGTTNPGQT